jgi:hypothetical protein
VRFQPYFAWASISSVIIFVSNSGEYFRTAYVIPAEMSPISATYTGLFLIRKNPGAHHSISAQIYRQSEAANIKITLIVQLPVFSLKSQVLLG